MRRGEGLRGGGSGGAGAGVGDGGEGEGEAGATAPQTKRLDEAVSADQPRSGAEASGNAIGWNRPARTGPPRGTGRPSRHARNGAEARTCRAMPQRRGKGVHRILHEDLQGDWSSQGCKLCNLMEKRKGWGASRAMRCMGQGNKMARAGTSTAVLVPLQRLFGFGRHPSPPGCSGYRISRGRKRVCHTHVHHHWLPQEVQEEVSRGEVSGSVAVAVATAGRSQKRQLRSVLQRPRPFSSGACVSCL